MAATSPSEASRPAGISAGPVVPEPKPLHLPRPWTDDVVYMVLLDRFHRLSHAQEPKAPWHGGSLAGLRAKLDYLCGLGVTALWVSPVFKNQDDGFHGYWPVDFFSVDPRFGTLEDLQGLVKDCHARGVKVLLDMVVNHAGYEHPMAKDPAKKDWFHRGQAIRWVDQGSLERGSLHGLPDFAQEKPEVAAWLTDMALWWIERTGVDGFRLDAVKHVPASFWKRFSGEIAARHRDFFLVGEVFRGVPRYIGRYQREDGIHSVLDVPFADTVRSALARDSEEPGPSLWERLKELRGEYRTMLFNEILRKVFARRPTDMRWFHLLLESEDAYVHPELLAPFIDNHDLSRFISEAGGSKERLKMALAVLMCWRGIPIITYGTEAGMSGRTEGSNRSPMVFGADPELEEHLRGLIKLRRAVSAFTRGRLISVLADRQVFAFMRDDHETRALCILNNSREPVERVLEFPAAAKPAVWLDAFTGERVVERHGKLALKLPARSARILVVGWRVAAPGSAERLSAFRPGSGKRRTRQGASPA
ncbi:MAG: alpha-glucosidase C-terminal domain-containing protein [Elusimicrobia bacterium]|nr:alpha-glucosidase C-terminal domain-containing protein [Elusimicrobiota bacterium]